MEQKKQLLIKVLQKLQPYRNLAEGVLALVESPYCDEKTIDGAIHFISEGIHHIKQERQESWAQKVQTMEAQHHETEMKDIQEAEDLLKTI